jgi:4-amino-4-deoxy-L-arabinose transferase-like glycosyltransferase
MGLEEEQIIKEKTLKIRKWLVSNYAIILILVASFAIRLYYFILTKDQTLWWDEAEYMATAKHWAFNVPYDLNPQRPPLFQLLGAFFLKIGFSELYLKFILVLLPSVFLILCIYFLGKEMFNKRIAIISALASAFMWSFLFWTSRFQPDFLSLCFQVLGILFYWKSLKSNNLKQSALAGFFLSLAFYFKITALLVPICIALYSFFREGAGVFKNKVHWIALSSFILTFIPFMIWQYVSFGNPLAFAPSYAMLDGKGRAERELGWMALTFFASFPKIIFFALFLITFCFYLFRFLISIDLSFKEKRNNLDSDLFSIITLIFTASYFIFFTQGIIEDRWIMIIVPFIFFFSAKGFEILAGYLKKINTYAPALFIILIFIVFIYSQSLHNHSLTLNKIPSYAPIKDSALWIKDNTEKGDSFLSVSFTQATTYSERKVITYALMNSSILEETIQKEFPKYLVVSLFENHPNWIGPWTEENKNALTIARIYFLDENKQNPSLIIYQINSSYFI